jgi:hypothetical protein
MITLSGVVRTIDGAKRLPRLLPDLCALCDEVVVLVDSRTGDDTFEIAHRYTDRVFAYEHDERDHNVHLAAFERARGNWILRMADDETLSPQWRRDRLEPLFASRTITHVATPTRRLVPPGDRAIRSGRWYPNYELRLYRNIPSIAVLESTPHDAMTIAGEELRVADLNVYLAVEDRATREARAEIARRGEPTSSHAEFLLYEDEYHETDTFHDRPDGELVGRVLEASSPSPHTIDIRASEVPARMAAGEPYAIRLEIANRTGRELTAPSRHLAESNFAIGYHWFGADGSLVQFAPEELPLFASFEPFDVRAAYVTVRAPFVPGRYALTFDVLERGVTWFSQSFAAGDHPVVEVEVFELVPSETTHVSR